MKCVYFVVFLFGIFLHSISCRHVNFYRKDYTYIEEYDAFYKVHWDSNGASWNSAFLACENEGAALFYPEVKEEWALVPNLIKKMTVVPNVTEIFVGIHDEFGISEFVTVDGHSTPYPLLAGDLHFVEQKKCLTMNIETGLFKVDACLRTSGSPLPFMCKKVDIVESCPTIDRGYTYSKDLRKCYKLNKMPQTWQEAMQTCFMEGGLLAVIKNREADYVGLMADSGETYFIGVRKIFSETNYYTVKGQEFTDWYHYRENNEESYDCGVVYMGDQLGTSTEACDSKLPFICEMEINVKLLK